MSQDERIAQDPIMAFEIPPEGRAGFMNTMFRGHQDEFEDELYMHLFLTRFSPTYKRGPWRYFVLSNGGCYLAPALDGRVSLSIESNFFYGDMSSDAAGIVVSLFVMNYLARQFPSMCLHLDETYHQLLDFACTHPESGVISAAID